MGLVEIGDLFQTSAFTLVLIDTLGHEIPEGVTPANPPERTVFPQPEQVIFGQGLVSPFRDFFPAKGGLAPGRAELLICSQINGAVRRQHQDGAKNSPALNGAVIDIMF